jgi:hypothetical protein
MRKGEAIMGRVKTGLLVAVAACVVGWATPARACHVSGTIVCQNDTSKGVSGVEVTLTSYVEAVGTASTTDGTWATQVNFTNMDYVLNLDGKTYTCDANGDPIVVGEIQVDDPVQCGEPPPPPPPPPPACTPKMPTGVVFPYCPARPLGNPKAECDLFGLAVLDKTDISGGGKSILAADSAVLALVKAGGCYDVFLNVIKDQTVLTAPFSQGISHVTYCTCK